MTAHQKSAERKRSRPIAAQKAINLALQGGGCHSAFTWGVLDRLLEDERLTFDGVSATSTGCINAVLLADGLAAGGRAAAKELLRAFWKKMSDMASLSLIAPSFFDKINPTFGLEHSPGYLFVDMISRFMSPYQLNPFDINPMRDLLNEIIDFERVRRQQTVKLYLCATTVRTGKIAVFTNKEITADHMHRVGLHAVSHACARNRRRALLGRRLHGQSGDLSGDLRLQVVATSCLIRLTPAHRSELPTSARAILDRMEEISFNAALMREMRVISFMTELIDEGKVSDGKRMFIHSIEAEDIIKNLAASSKMNADWTFLTHLFERGREYADAWLTENFDSIGVETTVDLKAEYF